MNMICFDLEGVLVPEIWIAFSEVSGIPELRRTTRDELPAPGPGGSGWPDGAAGGHFLSAAAQGAVSPMRPSSAQHVGASVTTSLWGAG